MYIQVYSEPEHNQCMRPEAIKKKLSSQFKTSRLIACMSDNQFVAFLMFTSINSDKYFPETLKNNFPKSSIYIAEVMVAKPHRAKGIATTMLEMVFEVCKKESCNDVFIRVRSSNLGALQLYEKLGFAAIDTIEQPTLNAAGTAYYPMKKTYLHKSMV